MWALCKKELWMYFGSAWAYVVALVFVVVSALFLWFLDTDYNIFQIGNANAKSFFQIAPWLLLLLIPALTMRSFAEEFTSGTMDWLFSKPIHIRTLIFAKFCALWVVILFGLIPTFLFIYTLAQLSIPEGNLDYGMIFSGYLGLMFMALTFVAIGIWASALTKNVVYSYLLSFFLNFVFFFGLEKISSFNSFGSFDYVIKQLGFPFHYTPFVNGLIDTRDLCYFVLCIFSFLSLTYVSLQKQK